MKWKSFVVLLVVLSFCMFSSGCVETGQKTTKAGTAFAGYELVEHTYLWGSEGPFSKTYDIRIWLIGTDVFQSTGISESEVKSFIQKYSSSSTNSGMATPTPKPTTLTPIVVSTASVKTGVSSASPSLEVVGNVMGIGSGNSISTLNISLAITGGATPVNMDEVTVTYSDSTNLNTLKKTPGINTLPSVGAWSIGQTINNKGASNKILDSDEIFVIIVKPTVSINPNQKFSIELKPPIGQALVISRTAPSSISKINVLY